VIDNYQKNGVDVRDAGSTAEVGYNRIFGMGPTTVNAQNGVVVLGIATATIRHNFVAKNIYTPAGTEATGVLLFSSGKVVTDRNTLTYNEVNVDMFQAAAGSSTTNNHVRAGTDDGILVDGSNGVRVAENKVEDNDGSGILLDNGDNNVVEDNKVGKNGTAGADLTDGIRLEVTSTGNTIEENRLRDNVTHDCHDDGTGNIWKDNHGETSQPPGLCNGGHDKAEDDRQYAQWDMSTAFGWDANYPWFTEFGEAAEFDWVAAYAEIDTASLLELLPTVTGTIRRLPSNPQP
jgi:parallel beta-helix repeat protein